MVDLGLKMFTQVGPKRKRRIGEQSKDFQSGQTCDRCGRAGASLEGGVCAIKRLCDKHKSKRAN